ncbi:MAG: hypothetical protein V7641_2568 [Blastocatellia bacterium]
MRRLTCCMTIVTFIFANSCSVLEPRPALPFTSLRMAASAAAPEDIVSLPFDTPVAGSIPPRHPEMCRLATTQYVVQYPGGATRIKIEVSAASDLAIYARFEQRVATENGSIIADFSAAASQPFYFPVRGPHLFEAGTYFIALANCGSEQADYTIQARLLTPTDADTAAVTPETSFGAIPAAMPGLCSLGRTQYRVTTPGVGPCGSGIITFVGAFSNQNINLYIRRDQRVAVEDGRIVADLATPSPMSSQAIILSSGGTYFIAVGNCSAETANYTVALNIAVVDPDFGPLVNGCRLTRNPSGAYVLTVFGAAIKAGATVTVGGVRPKKIQFIELEPGSPNTYRTIRLVKKFCGGLPGNIIVTNPGSCGGSGVPFFCNEVCAN